MQRSGFLDLRQMQTGSLEYGPSLLQQRPSNTGRYCYSQLVQVLIYVKLQQEPGTVEIEFTAVTSSPGQAAVCRVRVEVRRIKKTKKKSLLYIFFVFQVRDIQPPLVTGCPHSKTVFLEPGEVKIYKKSFKAKMSKIQNSSGCKTSQLDRTPVHRQCED